MSDDSVLSFAKSSPHLAGIGDRLVKPQEDEGVEESCAAFGYLRGIRDRALAVEFRFRDGNSDWFAYNLLGSWRYNPSCGLMLKFAGGDVVTIVLILGNNLDLPIPGREVKLTSGLQRHRVTYVREMGEDELRRARDGETTIDHIKVAEFESADGIQAYLRKTAPVFARPSRQA